MFKRIEKKILFCFLILSVVPLVITMSVTYTTGVNTIRGNAFDHLSVTASALRNHVYTFIRSQKDIVCAFASDMEIRKSLKVLRLHNVDHSEIVSSLKNHLEVNKLPLHAPNLLDISVLNHEGVVIASTLDDMIGTDKSDDGYFVSVRNRGYFSDLQYSPIFLEPVFEVSANVIDNLTGEFLGVVVNTFSGSTLSSIIKINWFDDYNNTDNLNTISSYYIVNRNKKMLTESMRADNPVLVQLVNTDPVRKALDDGIGMAGIYNDYNGNTVVGASVFIKELGWVILAEKDASYVFSPLFKLKAQMITFLIITLGIIMAVSSVLSKKITGPIRLLVDAMRRRSLGEVSYRVENISSDELGHLTTSYNNLCDELQKLTISRDFFERILHDMNDAVIITDTLYNIKDINIAVLEMFGYRRDELIGNSLLKLFGVDTLTNIDRTINRDQKYLVQNGVVCSRSRDARDVIVNISSFPTKSCAHEKHVNDCNMFIRTNGCVRCKNVSIVNIIHNITKQKEIEETLIQAKKSAVDAAESKSSFLASMSHEIRTPMNGIMGMAELLLETALSSEQREYSKTVYSCANSLLTIINDILDFSKIEAGKLEMENIDFDLRATMDDIIDIFAVKTKEKKGFEFFCYMDPEIPFLLRGDPGRLRQVLINLAGNAVKFTKEGEVSINVKLEKETESHTTVRFDIKDSGIGIPEERQDRLFQSFSQVDSSTTRKYGGTGLGLVISKQIVELMNGNIGFESREGAGTTFWFTVTFEKQPADQQKDSFEIADIDNMRILIVDDNRTNLKIFGAYLKSWHCRFDVATSAEEAMLKLHVAASAGDPFKVALLDYCLPGTDGESLGRQIKAATNLKDIILVMLTSLSRRGDAAHFHERGFAAYLLKPIKQLQLRDSLRIVTGKSTNSGKVASDQIVTRHSIPEEYRRRVRILLAEDNVVNQRIAVRLLEKKLGYHTDLANNGIEAIKALETIDYNLILMDCQMPEMDGYETTKTIRDPNSSVKNHNIPIIAMTANAMEGDRVKCIEAGMDDYVPKPIKVQKLADAIERNLCKLQMS